MQNSKGNQNQGNLTPPVSMQQVEQIRSRITTYPKDVQNDLNLLIEGFSWYNQNCQNAFEPGQDAEIIEGQHLQSGVHSGSGTQPGGSTHRS